MGWQETGVSYYRTVITEDVIARGMNYYDSLICYRYPPEAIS